MTSPTATAPFTPDVDPATATRATLSAYLQALNARGDYARYLHDDATLTIFGGPEASGRVAVEELINALHLQLFDAEVRVRRTICEGDGAAAELMFVGTHTGEFAGVPASGRHVEVPYSAAYDFSADARITAVRVYMPMQMLLAQIGAGGEP
jgi:predicted ester cyclase